MFAVRTAMPKDGSGLLRVIRPPATVVILERVVGVPVHRLVVRVKVRFNLDLLA